MTPLMEQYHAIKKDHPNELLFFRLGDFYEMFYEDAKAASRAVGLTLTSRFKGDKAVPMAGVPVVSVNTYLARLLRAGFRVAVCEQTQEAEEAEGLVERAVVRVITAGTLTEEGLLDQKQANFLAAVCPDGARFGLAWIDLSTGQFRAEDVERRELLDEFARIDAAEALVPESAVDTELARDLRPLVRSSLTACPDWTFERKNAARLLAEHFGTRSLAGFGCDDLGAGVAAAGAALAYLQQTQKSALGHITQIERFARGAHLLLDRATQASLELVQTLRGREVKGTLLWVLDRTRTPMGARLLRDWITTPLVDAAAIRARHDAVAELAEGATVRDGLEKVLGQIPDIERIAATLGSGRAHGRHLAGLRQALTLLPGVVEALRPARSPLLAAAAAALAASPSPARQRASALAPCPAAAAAPPGAAG
ncbi:MAG: DNA mismatch repair protein MutS, partial [Planctomycetes bacterium]|nr:DNA mismatch repair protein MutS [Planctomycetota bacterium]